MIPYDCDTVRDLLPEHAHARLLPHEADGVDSHLAACPACSGEAWLIRVLAESPVAAPPGLEARVRRALRLPARRWGPPVAAAALLAAAVIAGAALERLGRGADDPLARGEPVEVVPPSWAVAIDPLLHAGTSLDQLSVEELEIVLAELDR